jgi:multicomponent K+:H+ antiporter subunit F
VSGLLFTWSIVLAQLMLAVAAALAVWRMMRGPRAQDRVLALDTLNTTAMLLVLTFGVRIGDGVYFEAALVIALLGFASTMAIAKFLMRGEVIE